MKEIISGLALVRNVAVLFLAVPGLGIVQIAE